MPTNKRIDGDYVIVTLNSEDNVIIDTNTVKVFGNLDIEGNLTYINVNELNIQDPFIVLNASNTGSYSSNSGVLTHETATNYAGIRYNSTVGEWQVSTLTDATGLTGSWLSLSTGNASAVVPGGANTNIQFNDGGSFGGNANFAFDKSTNKVTLKGPLALGNIATAPSAPSNAAALYNAVKGSGGTGVYVKSATVDDELVSKSAAIVFAIIF
jgi:hypothetical protein